MDQELRDLERRARVSPDDGALQEQLLLARDRAGPEARRWLLATIAHVFELTNKKKSLDLVVPIDEDSTLDNVWVFLSGSVSGARQRNNHIFDKEWTRGGRAVRIKGHDFTFVDGDQVIVEINAPLGKTRTTHVLRDPRLPREVGVVRRVCMDCDEETDQHGDCLCTLGLLEHRWGEEVDTDPGSFSNHTYEPCLRCRAHRWTCAFFPGDHDPHPEPASSCPGTIEISAEESYYPGEDHYVREQDLEQPEAEEAE